jgi:hypothetical protein
MLANPKEAKEFADMLLAEKEPIGLHGASLLAHS